MRILITGAAGFVGSHLLDHLRTQSPEAELHGTVLSADHMLRSPDATRHIVNLLDPAAARELIETVRPDRVYHLAASANVHRSFEDPWSTLENNIRAQLNVLQALVESEQSPRVLVVSSGEVYGSRQSVERPTPEDAPLYPANPYAVSKVAQDYLALQYTLSHNLPIMRARPFNHVGPGQGPGFVAPDFARQVALIEAGRQEPLVRCGDLSTERDFTDVRDIVRAYHLLIEHGQPGEAYNVSSGHTVQIREVLRILMALCPVEITIREQTGYIRATGVNKSWGDHSRLTAATGWMPSMPLETTIRDVLEDWRQRVALTPVES